MEEMFRTLGLFMKKYFAQIMTIFVGLGILLVGLTPDKETGFHQNSYFTLGGVGLIIAGIISTLYVAEIINRLLHNIFLYGILPVLFAGFAYMDYRSVKDEMDWIARVDDVKTEVVQRLKDIRDAQVEYKSVYGHFTPSFDSLKWFIKDGQAMDIKRYGDVPQQIDIDMAKALGMKEIPDHQITEQQAWILMKKGFIPASQFRRDTTYQPVMDKLFRNEKAIASRKSKWAFSVDSLDVAPYGTGQFIMHVDSIQKNGLSVSVFEVIEPKPLVKQPLQVGSITEYSVNGNWGE